MWRVLCVEWGLCIDSCVNKSKLITPFSLSLAHIPGLCGDIQSLYFMSGSIQWLYAMSKSNWGTCYRVSNMEGIVYIGLYSE